MENFTLLVSDNGSTDSSLDIARWHASIDDRVKVLSGERGDAASNFQFLLEQCATDYFMWAAHDDLWDRKFLQSAVAALDEGHSYFTANWFVGDLDRHRGVSHAKHPLGFLQRGDSLERTVTFLNLHHLSHKCNLVYAVYRMEFLQGVHSPGSIANDGLFTAQVAHASPGYVTDSVLFRKEDRFAGRSRGYQLARQLLGRPRFLSRGRLSRPFEVAKARALDETTNAFPSLSSTLLRIFEAYDEFPRDDSFRIVEDLTSLLEFARIEAKHTQGLSMDWPE